MYLTMYLNVVHFFEHCPLVVSNKKEPIYTTKCTHIGRFKYFYVINVQRKASIINVLCFATFSSPQCFLTLVFVSLFLGL